MPLWALEERQIDGGSVDVELLEIQCIDCCCGDYCLDWNTVDISELFYAFVSQWFWLHQKSHPPSQSQWINVHDVLKRLLLTTDLAS